MAKLLKLRRGTTSDHNSFTGAEGEVTVDTTKDSLVVHDGSTQGGHPIAKSADLASYVPLAGGTLTGNIVFDNDNQIQFQEATSNGNAYVGLKAPTDMGSTSSYTVTLPSTAPSTGQVLKTDSSSATQLTWAADTNTNTTYTISCVDGDNSDEEKIRLTDSGSGTDDVVLEAGTGLSIARSGDKITFTNTVSDTNTTYSAGTGLALSSTTFSLDLSTDQTWTGAQRGAITTLSISSNAVAIDFNSGNNFYLDLGGAGVTSVTASNPTVGQSGSIIVKGHGSNTLAGWNAVYKWSGGSAPTITADASKYDRIDYFIYATDKIQMVWSGNY